MNYNDNDDFIQEFRLKELHMKEKREQTWKRNQNAPKLRKQTEASKGSKRIWISFSYYYIVIFYSSFIHIIYIYYHTLSNSHIYTLLYILLFLFLKCLIRLHYYYCQIYILTAVVVSGFVLSVIRSRPALYEKCHEVTFVVIWSFKKM